MVARIARFGVVFRLFSHRFGQGISFPNFVERSALDLPLSKLCALPLALQDRASFEGIEGRKGAEKRGVQTLVNFLQTGF